MKTKIAMLVVSCDKYSDLWPIFFGLWFKYWPSCPFKIYLGTNFKEYVHKDITMINIGADSDYSTNLITMVNAIEEDYIMITVEDLFLSQKVDEMNFDKFIQEFFENKAKFFKLIHTYPLGYDHDTSKRIAAVSDGVKYRIGVGAALWDKKVLKENLMPGLSAWEMEKAGDFGRDIPSSDIYALNYHFGGKHPFQFVHGVIKGAWLRNSIKFLVKEGYGSYLPNRPILGWYQYLYLRMFGVLMFVFKATNYKWKK